MKKSDQQEADRILHNTYILLHADPALLFRLRDAAKIMEAAGWIPEAMASSVLLDIVIRMRK